VHNEVVVNRFTTIVRHHRTRAFAVAILLLAVISVTVAPLATASADPAPAGATAPGTDAASPSTTIPSDQPADAPTTTAPTTTASTTTPTTAPPTASAPSATATTAPSATNPPLTSAPAVPDDDGVPADVEASAPHNGDNNLDGIADADQANVASLPAAIDVDGDGALDDYVSIVSPAGTSLRDVRSVPVPSDNPPPDGVRLPYGLFDYDVEVAQPGDAAAVTYITPGGFVPTSVHFLQGGEWSELTERTEVNADTGDATVKLQDGGAGDADPAADAVIADPSGPSTRDRSITVKVVSGAGAPAITVKLESCTNNGIGSSCSSASPVPASQGSNDAAGQSAALADGAAWNWGGDGVTQLAQDTRYRLSVSSALPASGWDLTDTSCTGVNEDHQSASADNAENIYLQDDSNARATCTFTFAPAVASITVHKGGDRDGSSVEPLAGATFQVYSNSSYSTPVAGASCVTAAGGTCVIADLSPNTTYYVRETTAPSNFQRIDTMTTSSGGSQVYGQQVTTGANGSNVGTRTFANRRINPAYPSECGIDIALVMDLSNSIDSGELAQMKTSAKAFVTALQGTPSKVAGYTFATQAPASGQTDLSLTDVSSTTGADTARTWIDDRTGQQGGTNWDAGLQQIVANAGSYDIVVFLTDGNPTYYGYPHDSGQGNGGDTTLREVEEGVFSSNGVKAANSSLKMVGVAIGSGASTDNIAAISGPNANDDYFLAANFQDLQNKLQQIASQLCGGTITVKKQVEGPGGFAPAGGWTFKVDQAGQPQQSGDTAPVTGVTSAFDVEAGTATVTETQQSGYSIVQQGGKNATCTKNGTAVPSGDITNTANGISLDVGALDIVACEFRNTPTKGTIQVEKQTLATAGGPFTFTVTGPDTNLTYGSVNTAAPGTPVIAGTASNLFPGQYVVTETSLPPTWSLDSITCPGATIDLASKKATITVTGAGGTTVCTFTNKPLSGTIELQKSWSGALTGDAPTANLQIGTSNGGAQVANVPVTGPSDGTTGAKSVGVGTYYVQESGLAAGWLQSALRCSTNGGGAVNYVPADGVAVPAAGSVVCTITNTRQTGSVRVNKVWSGGVSGETPKADLNIVGLSPSSTTVTGLADGTTGTKSVVTGTYSVDESNLAENWTQTSASCVRNGTGDAFGPTGFSVAAGDSVVCTITNTRDAGTIRVDKAWVGGAVGDTPQATLDIGGPSASSTPVSGLGIGTTGTKTVVTGTYTVGESGLTSGWHQQSITCQNGTQPPFTPPAKGFAVAKGDSVVCTITNAKQGTITIVKDAQPNAAQDFGFTTSDLGGGFTLRDDGTTANTKVFSHLDAGSYSVTEDANPNGWALTSVSCVGTGGSGDLATRTATIQLPAGGDVTCTFTNTGPDVGIVKTDSPDPVQAGTTITYSLAVHNYGPPVAAPVQVSDPLPADTTFVSSSAGGGWSCTSPAVGSTGTVSCSLASLAAGADAPPITVVVKVGAGVAPGTDVVSNTATVSTPHDSNPDNNTSTAKTSVVRVLDLSVTKSDGGATPVAGGDGFTYTITVDNLGPSDASVAATVTDTLPAGVSFVGFGDLADGVDCTPPVAGVLTCTVDPSLLHVVDPAVVITLDVTVPASTPAGTVTNSVAVTTPEEPCPGSPDCDNNTDHTDTPVTTSVDLTIHKSDGGAQPVSGVTGSNAFTYTLTVKNDGPSDASADATVTDVMPAGVDFVSFGSLPAGVTCSPPSGRTIVCTIGQALLQVSSPPVVILVDVTVPASTPGGDVTNKVIVSNPDDEAPCTVTATDITCDPSDTDNYDQVTTPVVQVAPDVVTPTTPPVQVEAASLAFTGSDAGRLALLGAALVGFGAVLVLAVRRRRRHGTR
jgi:uncharacterized repeat protein (TIGR01451 family)